MSKGIDRLRTSRKSGQLNRGRKNRTGGARMWLWMMGIGALALALVLPLSMAFAVYEDGLFELGELWDDPQPGSANIVNDSEDPNDPDAFVPDWADIFDENGAPKPLPESGVAGVFIKDYLAVKGQKDHTTFTGSKNDDPHADWKWVTGNVPAKDDLSNVYLYGATNEVKDFIL